MLHGSVIPACFRLARPRFADRAWRESSATQAIHVNRHSGCPIEALGHDDAIFDIGGRCVMIKQLLWLMIAVTTLILTGFHLAAENAVLAIGSFLLGAAWLFLEVKQKRSFPSVFMPLFIASALLAALNHESSPLILLAVVTDLAAWDLSRFLSRLRPFAAQDISPDLYTKHLYRLAVPLCAGFGLALVPMFVRLPVSFVAFLVLTLLAVIMFRKAVLGLRGENERRSNG
jgi:hypothetical protein